MDLSTVQVSFKDAADVVQQSRLAVVTAETLAARRPWRVFRWHRCQGHYSGWYWSATMGRHVVYESRLELARLLLADFDRQVVAIAAQPFLVTAPAELAAWVGGRVGGPGEHCGAGGRLAGTGGRDPVCSAAPALARGADRRGPQPAAARGAPDHRRIRLTPPGFEFTDLAPPAGFVPLDKARSFRDPPPPGIEPFLPAPFWEQRLEGRGALGHPPWEDYRPGRAEHGTCYRMDEHRHGWFAPSADLTFHLLGSCRPEWVFAHNLARHAGQGYASAEMALWDFGPDGDDEEHLVAYATQVCFFSFA